MLEYDTSHTSSGFVCVSVGGWIHAAEPRDPADGTVACGYWLLCRDIDAHLHHVPWRARASLLVGTGAQ